jgi:hypothetical protein
MTLKINALYLLLIAESFVVLLGLSFYLMSSRRKLRKLYRKTLKDLASAQDLAGDEAQGAAEEQRPVPPPVVGEEMPAAGEKPASILPDIVTEELPHEEVPDDGDLGGKVQKLQRIVDLQKDKVLDLMCYKDIFEGAQRKLNAIQTNYQELQEKISSFMQSSGDSDELAAMSGILESSNRDLESYISILAKENEKLSDKFDSWENDLKEMSEATVETSGAGSSGSVDEVRHEEILREKEELMAKVGEFEEKLSQKGSLLDEIQKQYEDMEKEYMILYNKQMAQEQPT